MISAGDKPPPYNTKGVVRTPMLSPFYGFCTHLMGKIKNLKQTELTFKEALLEMFSAAFWFWAIDLFEKL